MDEYDDGHPWIQAFYRIRDGICAALVESGEPYEFAIGVAIRGANAVQDDMLQMEREAVVEEHQ